ncbi:MAG: hypothetical protein E7384_01910 [Ruminococcaceae bacterium]|nr:hypothetical protein [Oscillospiraceae bacterium]
MKKFLSAIGTIIATIIFIPIVLVVCLCYLLFLPIDIIRYHRMPYYKNLKVKYCLFLTSRNVVRFYNYIVRKKLSIEYVKHNELEYFVKDGEVLLCGWSFDMFEETDGEWYFDLGDETKQSIQESLQIDTEFLKPEHQSMSAKYLLFYDDITDAERFEKAKECPYFYCVFSMDEIG